VELLEASPSPVSGRTARLERGGVVWVGGVGKVGACVRGQGHSHVRSLSRDHVERSMQTTPPPRPCCCRPSAWRGPGGCRAAAARGGEGTSRPDLCKAHGLSGAVLPIHGPASGALGRLVWLARLAGVSEAGTARCESWSRRVVVRA
jgi:hypothetical protein